MAAARQMRPLLLLAAAALAAITLATGLTLVHGWRTEKRALLSPEGEPPRPRPAAAETVGGFLLFGDSRVAHWKPPARPYPITRLGHPGETAIRLAQPFEAALDRHRPQQVLLMVGVNDAVAIALLPADQQDRAIAATLSAFDGMARAARVRRIPLSIALLIPPDQPDPLRRLLWGAPVDPLVARMNAALPAIAAANDATLVDARALLAPPDQPLPPAFRADALHFTPQAYQRLSALLPPSLEPASASPAAPR